MPTNIGTLPYELILRVIELSVEDTSSCLTFTTTRDGRYKHLCKMATVSRFFREPSQAVLWSSVRIDSQPVAHKWLSSPVTIAERYGVKDLEIRGVHLRKDGVTASAANRIVGRCRGVQRLELHDFGRLSVRILEQDALYGLKHLVLLSSFPDKPAILHSLELPFHLRNLQLYNRMNSPILTDKLLSTSSCTLRVLELSLHDHDSSYEGLVRSFHFVAPTLVHLCLNHKPTPPLVAALQGCQSLKHLECHTSVDVGELLDQIPSSLESLTIQVDYNLQEVVELLEMRMEGVALSELKVLKMSETTLAAFRLHPAAQEFRTKYAERGLVIKAEQTWDRAV